MRRLRAAWFVIAALGALLVTPLRGIYLPVETRRVPVARLVANLEKQLGDNPKSAELLINLARLYGMAYSMNATELPSWNRPGGGEEVWFGHEPKLVPHRDPSGETRAATAGQFLEKAGEHYKAALGLQPENLLARLGYGWFLERRGDRTGAAEAFRAVIRAAWPKEQAVKMGELGQRFYTVEAAELLIPLLDPKADAAEIAELRRRIEYLGRVPRPITPIAIPVRHGATIERIVDLDARVRFDADGTGLTRQWTWITPEAGWLVYDAEGRREITSALQWLGNVSFWLSWANGYEALRSLDDDGNGELTGTELRHLAVWRDADADGVSDPGEVKPLGDLGIVGLSCRFGAADGLLAAAMAEQGVRFDNGQIGPTYDVILRPARSVSAP